MSDLQNPLFDEEKEFLERKKLEYERALRGDVEDIKEKSAIVGKVALVGAGLAGSVWLIAKAFGGKKKKRTAKDRYEHDENLDGNKDENLDEQFESDNGFGAEYYTAGNGKRYKSVPYHKSAANSAQAFMENEAQERRPDQGHQTDDLGFGSNATSKMPLSGAGSSPSLVPSAFNPEEFEDDPFKDLPYDDSRRLPTSHDFDGTDEKLTYSANFRSSFAAQVLQNFLKSDTGKVLVAQAAAVVLALVTKKVSEFFPADKNPDLADSPAVAPAETGFAPAVSPASPDFLDASIPTSAI